MKIVFQINGGIGKNIAATAVCKAIKAHYPAAQLIVLTSYPEVFLCNPHVHRALGNNDLNYFYKDHIEGGKVLTFLHDPYLETDFVAQKAHLIEAWCRMCGVPYHGELPELYLTATEQAYHRSRFPGGKPILLLQTNGGMPGQATKYSWTRDIPQGVAQAVANAFKNDYHIAHIRREDQPALDGTIPVHADLRTIAVLIQASERRLFIDSFAQHAAAALLKPSVVCWVGNKPGQFGYGLHANVLAAPPTRKAELRQGVYNRYDITGQQQAEFPYHHESEIFNPDFIINTLRDYHHVFAPAARVLLDAPTKTTRSPFAPSHIPSFAL